MSITKTQYPTTQKVSSYKAAVAWAAIGIGMNTGHYAGSQPQEIVIVDDGDCALSEEDEWAEIAKDSLTSAEHRAIAAYLKKTGQASM